MAGIDPDTAVFAPLTKGEIGAFTWHYVRDLPATTEEANKAYLSSAGTKHRFFMVIVRHGMVIIEELGQWASIWMLSGYIWAFLYRFGPYFFILTR